MPRSSRHKSSKHGSRDARDYSDSEKDSSSKDRKSKDESSAKVLKESGSVEKRKLDSRENNGVYTEHSSSKRRKERVDDGDDRWNGGDDDRGEGTKKVKDKLSESKSKRREENTGAYGESDEVVKKSSGKTEGKHRESNSRKEGREGGGERERNKDREKENERYRRSKEGKSEKLIEVDDMRKQVSEKSELSARDVLQSPEMDSLPDRRNKKRDDFDNGDKNHDEFGDRSDRRLSSREDITKNGRPKDEKHKDDRYRDKYREDVDRESRHRDDKQRDERAGKDHSNKSVDKISRDHKDGVEIRPRKPKHQDGDSANERDDDHDRDHHINAARDNDHESYLRERDRHRDRDREHDRDRDWERDRDRERERDRDRNFDYDVDDRSARYKDSRGRKRSPDDYDDYADTKSRGVKTASPDMEKRSMGSRVESDADRVKSQSSQAHADNIGGSSRRRTSPSTSSLGAADEYRHPKQEDLKYKDSGIEHRSSKSMSLRDVIAASGASERNSKYRSSEKPSKMDEGHIGELSVERSSSSKASPMGLVDRSPSSTSLERRYSNRPGVRRTLDIEESGKRSNTPMGSRDFPLADDRLNRDLPSEKNLMDDSTSVDSSFYNRTSQNNSAPIPPPFRSRVGSPSFMGPQEEDSRFGAGSRYKRSGDHNMVRGQGNAWRGPPNWSSPLPNGYIPFQHGPHHGAFPAMLPQFPSLFGVRPSMEINHSGIPYHISDADRFASHMRPLGWQNMMDGSGPAHMWDVNSGVFRDESHLYAGPDWDQARHSMNGRGWEGNADMWKGQNGDMNLEMPNMSSKEDFSAQPPVEELSVGQGGGQRSTEEGLKGKTTDTKTSVASLENDSGKTSDKTTPEKAADPKSLSNDNEHPYYAYLSQLDISTELVDPEMYDQFATLLKIKPSGTVEQDRSILVNLKDGGRAVPKNSSTLLRSSLFPATSASSFQRAMGIYKRQRSDFGGLPFVDGGIVDAILESKEVAPDGEPIPEEQVANRDDEMPDMNSPDKEVEANAIVASPEASECTPSKEAVVDAELPDLKLESSDKPVMDSNASEVDVVASNKPVNSGDNGEIEVSPSLITEGGENVEMEGVVCKTETLNREEEGQGNSDGKLGAPESGTNESEWVILSRIHHSPESTH